MVDGTSLNTSGGKNLRLVERAGPSLARLVESMRVVDRVAHFGFLEVERIQRRDGGRCLVTSNAVNLKSPTLVSRCLRM